MTPPGYWKHDSIACGNNVYCPLLPKELDSERFHPAYCMDRCAFVAFDMEIKACRSRVTGRVRSRTEWEAMRFVSSLRRKPR